MSHEIRYEKFATNDNWRAYAGDRFIAVIARARIWRENRLGDYQVDKRRYYDPCYLATLRAHAERLNAVLRVTNRLANKP